MATTLPVQDGFCQIRRLDRGLVEKLREKGAKRGLGYQTMLKVIMREHVDDY